MGYIREPEGVDFIIESDPLTDEDRKQISQFIREYKRGDQTKNKRVSVMTHQLMVKHKLLLPDE